VQVDLGIRHHLYELTVVTPDRPFLFASLTGTLTAWGMNIVKADAFANTGGIVLDTFRFVDLYRTLEMNPSESERFKASLVDVLRGRSDVQDLLSGRLNPGAVPRTKIRTPTQIRFDSGTSSHSTLLELIAQDRPGLLYQVSSKLAELGCNIEVALIDTEGQKAVDVFYLTSGGSKLDLPIQEAIRGALLERL
jgi:[protein-PII] uridylyltransferase